MDEQHIPDDPGPPPDEEALDPRVARDRHLLRNGESAGLLFLRALSAQERGWMKRMVSGVARRYGVDPDDLFQELQLSLLTCDTIDGGRRSVRGWLARRAEWRAKDLLRAARATHDARWSVDVNDLEPEMPQPAGLDADWSVDRIKTLGLNRDEAQIVLLIMWGLDVSLRDFSELAERSYPKIRQDKSRGINKIRRLFDLDPDESAATIAHRECGSMSAAADQLDISKTHLRILLQRANQKIQSALERTDQPFAELRREDESHAV